MKIREIFSIVQLTTQKSMSLVTLYISKKSVLVEYYLVIAKKNITCLICLVGA